MIVKCKKCEVQFAKTSSEISKSKSGNHFCSRSCAAKFNNSIYPKRKRGKKFCKECRLEINNRRTICDNCLSKRSLSHKTIKEALDNWEGHRSTAHSRIRSHARSVAKVMKNECSNCGYKVHVEVCHIRAINSFSLDSLVSEVNDLSNLVKLCRNCHWEFDNGLLSLSS